jgi:hypothetical protein
LPNFIKKTNIKTMKKNLLIGAALLAGVAAFAQNNFKVGPNNSKRLITGHVKNDPDAFPAYTGKRVVGPTIVQKSNQICSSKHLSSAPNILDVTALVDGYAQSMLTYKPDLNTISYTHRRSADWTFAGRNTGAIQTTWLNLTTGLLDSTIIYMDSTGGGTGRAPQGMIYNPAGNTNIANASVVATGIAAGFTGTLYATRKLTGTAADQALPVNASSYEQWPSPVFGNAVWANKDMSQVGTNIFATGSLLGAQNATTYYDPNVTTYPGFSKGGVIIKANMTPATPTWSIDSFAPGILNNNTTTGYAADGSGGRLAFSPDGMTGYFVLLGRLTTNYGNSSDSMLAPLVYKTTNGGTTWAFQTTISQGYDWNTGHPELAQNTTELFAGAHNFTPNSVHGIDLTVDANGTLHYVCVMQVPYLDGQRNDSLMFGYNHVYNYQTHRPILWDLMTDGNCWKTMLIDSLLSSEVTANSADTGYAANPWSDGQGGKLTYGARLQVSRSTDGTKIFYGWSDSDPGVTASPYNISPEIVLKGYDVSTQMLTPTMILTSIGTCFFHNISDISYLDNTSSKWVVPAVYSKGRVFSGGVYDGGTTADVDGADHYLVNCPAFAAADFNVTAVFNTDLINTGGICMSGIKTNNTFASSVNNYPNPFNHSTNIIVTLTENKAISVNVFDAIGNLVAVKNMNGNVGNNTIVFEAGNLNAGVYYYTVTAGSERATKKMVIQK